MDYFYIQIAQNRPTYTLLNLENSGEQSWKRRSIIAM